ncbi:MAG: helix-turn-helix transcriptional regulator [Bacteroidetes bacterium]|nr:helix-turn-helix transcriptional regulator [Bacteroidota bacterium]
MKAIGNKIRVLREVRGFSQEYVADRIGISQAAYSRLENEATDLTLGRLEQIASVLEINPLDLLAMDEKIVFNNINGHVYGIIHTNNHISNHGLSEEERKIYEDKITLQEELLAVYRKLNGEKS